MSITLPPLPEPTYGLGNGCERTYAYSADAVRSAQLAAVEAYQASHPQAVEAAPVAQAQPAEPQDVPSDLIIELAEAMQVRRILEQIKQVAATKPAGDAPSVFESAWALCCEEIFYRATGEQWHMSEDESHFSAAIRLKRFTSAAANEALAGVAQAQPESAAQARAAALEEAALTVESRRDLIEEKSAYMKALAARQGSSRSNEVARLRHHSTVSTFNAGLTRAAQDIRALAESPAAQPESAPVRVPMTEAEIEAIDPTKLCKKYGLAALIRAVELHHGIGSAA